MGCQRTITFTQSVGARLTPLHTAVYVASTDKILGTQMDHIIEFSAATGDYIRDVQTPWPMVGNMHLGLIDAMPYVAGHNNPAARDPLGTNAHDGYDIYPVDPATLGLGAGLQTYKTNLQGFPMWNQEAAFQFIQVGTKIFYIQPAASGYFLVWMNKTGFGAGVFGVDWRYKAFSGIWAEQICSDGTFIYIADPASVDLSQRDFPLLNEVGWGPFPSATGGEIGCEYAVNVAKVFAVCGNKWLEQVDSFGAHTATLFDMDALVTAGGTPMAGLKALRLRYRTSDGKLYIPCQNKDGVVVFDPMLSSLVWKSGFESPVDVVFTATKAFAVQSSINGLKEIT